MPLSQKIIEILKRSAQRIFITSQKILLAGALFFIYFFIFGWFSLLAKLWERGQLRKASLVSDSFWLKPALEIPQTENIHKQS